MSENQETEVLLEDDPLTTLLAGLSPEEAVVGSKIGASLMKALTPKIAREADAKYGAEYRLKFDKLQAENETALRAAIDSLRETAKPLSDEDVTKLLSQEYGEFQVPLAGPDGTITFVIRELSVASEKRLLTALKTVVAPLLQLTSSVEWASLAGVSQLERLNKVIELVPGALDVIAECVAICLDPRQETKFMSGAWVLHHLGVNRIIGIAMAQVSASRYRDFFSLVSRLFQQTRMTR